MLTEDERAFVENKPPNGDEGPSALTLEL